MWKKIVLAILIVISGVVGFLVAKAQVTLYDSLGHINRDYDTVLENVDLEGITVNSDDEIVNILVIGNDYREETGYTAAGLTDTMIIATMDLKHGTLKMTSLMRDCYVDIPGYGYNKLNSANSFGGIELLYKTIATNFNIELDGYIEVGFSAFTDIIDAVGGVELELTQSEADYLNTTNYIKPAKYRTVVAGKQTLNGAQALGYCRIRKKAYTITGLTDDYGRTWRQRAVVAALFDKIKTLPMTQWIDIANMAFDSITTDLTDEKLIGYMKDVVMMGTTQIHQLQIPIDGYYRGSSAGEYGVGDVLIMTNGTDSSLYLVPNMEALNSFIFDYDGEGDFTYGTFVNDES